MSQEVAYDKIDESIGTHRVPVEELTPHPENYRRGDVEKIAQSLVRFGQYVPIVAQESTGNIVKGNHTYQAAVGLGWTHIAALRKPLSDDDALALLIADNALSDLADNDLGLQAKILQRLMDTGGQMSLVGTGLEETEVADLLDAAHALTHVVVPDEPFTGEYAAGHPVQVQDVQDSTEPAKAPMREIVLLLEIEDAQLLGRRIRNLQKVYEEGGGLTATILRAVSTAHDVKFGSPDPAVAEKAPPEVKTAEDVVPAKEQETFQAEGAAPTTEPVDIEGDASPAPYDERFDA